MGCSKNLVDSEALTRLLMKRGYHCVHEPKHPQGEYVVVNTCGFINDAKQESIDMILQLTEAKRVGQIGTLIVMGCLSQRYLNQLEDEIPEVDRYYGKFNWREMASDLPEPSVARVSDCSVLSDQTAVRDQKSSVPSGRTTAKRPTWRQTPSHYAYVKISEGCDRRCAYCAIPLITGRHHSRPQEEILAEVRELVSEGVKEIQVIAQELTYYGLDLNGKRQIAELISRMAEIPGVEWIRLHYAYPHQFPLELLDVIREKKNVCNYLDIALQHISDHVLRDMQRNVTKAETLALIDEMRRRAPGIHLRTTLMVGFPGETDDDFAELLEFVKSAKFERMGAFAYSEEEGTYGAKHFADSIPPEVKERRLSKLMLAQQSVSEEVEARKVGQTLRVMIDRKEGDWYIGRTEYSSPEVDPEVLISADRRLLRGRFYEVLITASEEFDLYGEVVS